MNASQWSATEEFILYDRGKRRKFVLTSNDADIRANLASQVERPGQQGPAFETHKRFVRAHSHALAARQNRNGNVIRRGLSHVAIIPFAHNRRGRCTSYLFVPKRFPPRCSVGRTFTS